MLLTSRIVNHSHCRAIREKYYGLHPMLKITTAKIGSPQYPALLQRGMKCVPVIMCGSSSEILGSDDEETKVTVRPGSALWKEPCCLPLSLAPAFAFGIYQLQSLHLRWVLESVLPEEDTLHRGFENPTSFKNLRTIWVSHSDQLSPWDAYLYSVLVIWKMNSSTTLALSIALNF